MWGIGTSKAVKVISRGCKLLKIGKPYMPMGIYYTMPHSCLQCPVDVQVVKLCLQADTSCGLAINTLNRKVTGAPKLESIMYNVLIIGAKCDAGSFRNVGVEGSIRKRPS